MALDFGLKRKIYGVWYRPNKKKTINDLLCLSVGWLKKQGYLQKNVIKTVKIYWYGVSSDGDRQQIGAIAICANFLGENRAIELNYIYQGREKLCYPIRLIESIPYFGGVRYWFLCPNCGRKVAFLYGSKYFLCRKCHNLSYPSQQKSFTGRMLEMADKYERKATENDMKKRWMHWNTYNKLMKKSNNYELMGLLSLSKKWKGRK